MTISLATGAVIGSSRKAFYGQTTNGTTQYINFGNHLAYERTQAFSLCAWVKPSSSAAFRYVLSKRDGSQRGWAMSFTTLTAIEFFLGNGVGNGLIVDSGAQRPTFDFWSLIVATYDGTSLPAGVKFFHNSTGPVTASVAQSNLSATTIGGANIGYGARDTAGAPFPGQIGPCGVFSKALSTAEVAELYNGKRYFDWRTHSAAAVSLAMYVPGVRSDQDLSLASSVPELINGWNGSPVAMTSANIVPVTPRTLAT